MKKYLTFGALLLCVNCLIAQSYAISKVKTSAFYNATISIKNSAVNFEDNAVLNNWNEMPFYWEFYGEQVSGYRISENGYITFSQAETNNQFENGDLPNPSYPKNSIFCFWDNFTGVSKVTMDVYGLSPNRALVINWGSCTKEGLSGGLVMKLRIFEKSQDFQLLVSGSDFKNSDLSGTIGTQNADGSLGTMVKDYEFVDGFGSYYNFDLGEAVVDDAALVNLKLFDNLIVGNYPLRTTIKNTGINNIKTIELAYAINGQYQGSETFTGLDMLPTHYKNLTLADLIYFQTPGQKKEVCIWIVSVNGNADDRIFNNELCELSVANNNNGPLANVLIEESAATWCGFCPESNYVLENLVATYPERIFPVSIHNGDEMANEFSLDSCYGNWALPAAYINRSLYSPNFQHEQVNNQYYELFALPWLDLHVPLEIEFNNLYWNPLTRRIDVELKVNYQDFGIGQNTNIILMVVEDSLVGSGDGWDQANSYSNTPGHPFENAGNPLIDYVHRNVLREYIESDAFGIPVAEKEIYSPGESYSKHFSFALSDAYNEANISLVAAVVKHNKGQGNDPGVPGVFGNKNIINSNKINLSNILTTSMNDEQALQYGIEVFPNPTHSKIFIRNHFLSSKETELKLYDINGVLMRSSVLNDIVNSIDIKDLPAGMYIWTIYDGKKYHDGRIMKINE